jgi:hypothetical protein
VASEWQTDWKPTYLEEGRIEFSFSLQGGNMLLYLLILVFAIVVNAVLDLRWDKLGTNPTPGYL